MSVEDDGEEWDDGTLGAEWRADGGAGEGLEPDPAGGPPAVDPDHAAAVRTVRLVLAAAVLSVLGLIAVALADEPDGDGGGSDDPTLDVEAAVEVGPATGASLAPYLADRAAALAAADGTRVAVASLTSYRPDTAVEALVEGVDGVEVLARLVAVPGGTAEVIDGAVSSWVVDTRAALQAERDEIAALLPTIEDPADPFIAGYTEDLARLDAQLARLDPAGELVFGVVVRADAGALRRLAERPEVRLLDVAPDADLHALTRYRGVRPEELDLAGTPPTRPG